jgi:hypothetical protein
MIYEKFEDIKRTDNTKEKGQKDKQPKKNDIEN